jgi:hypothetical protein
MRLRCVGVLAPTEVPIAAIAGMSCGSLTAFI